MSASFKKRLKWYGSIFFIASIVFGVNAFQQEKVNRAYKWEGMFKCNEKHFFAMQRDVKPTMADQFRQGLTPMVKKKKGLLDGLQTVEQKAKSSLPDNDPRKHLSQSQIKEAERSYQVCVNNKRESIQEAKSKKDINEFGIGAGIFLMFFSFLFALIDFIVQLYKNGKITKIGMSRFMIVVSILWVLIAFSINYGYRGIKIDKFIVAGIVPVVVVLGLMWAFGLFKLKDKTNL